VKSPIDPTFHFPDDAAGGDPDSTSPTLKRYHKLLWSKPLPDGRSFVLDDTTPGAYLHHRSDEVGEFFLSSDSIIHTFSRWKRMQAIIRQFPPAQIDGFFRLAYSIGAMLVFPGNKIGRAATINAARGFHPRIRDRIDLTLECIRRHYLGESSNWPLADVLNRYANFFALFEDFSGYIEFFLLQDLAAEDLNGVRFLTDDFDDFASDPLPPDAATYRTYMDRSIAFIIARNERILEWAASELSQNPWQMDLLPDHRNHPPKRPPVRS